MFKFCSNQIRTLKYASKYASSEQEYLTGKRKNAMFLSCKYKESAANQKEFV